MRRLCTIAEIPAGGCLEFSLREGAEPDCFLVYRQAKVTAYRNRCPHTGAPLNWQPNVFLDYQGEHIQCDLHGALFRIEDGACFYGPCSGRGLQQIAVICDGNTVWLCEEDVPGAQ